LEALTFPKPGQIEAFFEWAVTNYVTPENLQYCIDNNLDIITAALNTYKVTDPLIAPIFRILVKRNWYTIESYFIESNKMYSLIAHKPDCQKIVSTPKGINYINRVRETSYQYIYNFVWGRRENT
jgi:hypothetical protein